ncbi:MAG TPA: hypothetical protein VKS21_01085 [Spirochaetota bacterium]|nr:hypothetical protein [Spirochaetota bacterium]
MNLQENVYNNVYGSAAKLARDYPAVFRLLNEALHERDEYKKNEKAYRYFCERNIVKSMTDKIPSNIDLDLSVIFKAKSFVSGDFCDAARYVEQKYMIWIGDSISHGTGSKIVKDVMLDIVHKVFRKFKTKRDYNISAFVKNVQDFFSSPKVVRRIIDQDLSDILRDNTYTSKMAITIPVAFLQIEKLLNSPDYQLRLVNRGMPLVLVFRFDEKQQYVKKCFFISRATVFDYKGKNIDKVTCYDHSGFPLALDRELFNIYLEKDLKNFGKANTPENIRDYIFDSFALTGKKGDVIVIPSDGVLDLYNKQHEAYSISRFIDDLIESLSDPDMRSLPFTSFTEEHYKRKIRQYTVWDTNFPMTGNGIEDDMTALFIKLK